MIISCPSCEVRFRVDAARLDPNGKNVRCSKCGHVWLAAPGGSGVPEIKATEQTVQRPEPKLSVREQDDGPDAGKTGSSENQDVARRKPPRSRLWIKVLLIFIIVAGLLLVWQNRLLVWQKMQPMLGERNAGSAVEQPAADVSETKAKPAQ